MKAPASRACGTVYETSDYSIFEMCAFNREVRKTKKLTISMRREGWVNAYPLHVRKSGKGKLQIIGGHHRFEVAQKENMPVRYVICDDNLEVCEIEDATNPWKFPDYLSAHIQLGDHDYIQVRDMHKKTGIGLSVCASLLSNGTSTFNEMDEFKRGLWTITGRAFADSVSDIVLLLKGKKMEWASEQVCVNSLARIIKGGHADISRLKKKIAAHYAILHKQPALQAYTDMWEDIYNRSERGIRVPLAFLTNEAMRQLHEQFGAAK